MDFQSQTKNNVEMRELRVDIPSAKSGDKGILHSKMLYYRCLPEKTKSQWQCAQPESSSVWWRSSKWRQTLAEANSATRDEEISGRVIQGWKRSFRSLWSELLHHSQQEDSQCFVHKPHWSLQNFLLHPFSMRGLPLFLWGEEHSTSYCWLLQSIVSDLKLFAFFSSFCLLPLSSKKQLFSVTEWRRGTHCSSFYDEN